MRNMCNCSGLPSSIAPLSSALTFYDQLILSITIRNYLSDCGPDPDANTFFLVVGRCLAPKTKSPKLTIFWDDRSWDLMKGAPR